MNKSKLALSRLWMAAIALACSSKSAEPPPKAPESAEPAPSADNSETSGDETPAVLQKAPPAETEPSQAGAAEASSPAQPPHTESAQEPDPEGEEQAAYQRAKPIFDAQCAGCHTARGKKANSTSLRHFRMDAYPFGGHHAAEIAAVIREVLGAAGSKPTMPKDKPGAVKGDDLALVLAWADARDRAHPPAAASHEHEEEHGEHQHHH